jgi:hypothetical protein
MYRLHIMHSSNPRDEWRHLPIILHGLKHIWVMETPENVVDEDGSDKAWGHPKASSLESSSCFLPSTGVDSSNELIQLSPSSCSSSFLVNGVGRMIGCGGRRRRELLIDRGGARSKGRPNRHKKTSAPIRLGQSVWAFSGPVRAQLSPCVSSSFWT